MSNDPMLPLHEAIASNDAFALMRALADSADLEALNQDGQTALQVAVELNRVRLMPLLLQAGANPNSRVPDFAWTPLHGAAVWGHTALIFTLVGAGADLEAREKHGDTPLYVAVASKQGEAVRALVEAGADIETRDAKGRTLLWRALEDEWAQGIQLLRILGADVGRSYQGQTMEQRANASATPELYAALFDELPPASTLLSSSQATLPPNCSWQKPLEPTRANLPHLSARVGPSTTGETTVYIVFYEDGYETAFGDGKELWVNGVFLSLEVAEAYIGNRRRDGEGGYYTYTGAFARLCWQDELFTLPDLQAEKFEIFSATDIFARLENGLAIAEKAQRQPFEIIANFIAMSNAKLTDADANEAFFVDYKTHFARKMPDYVSTYELFEREKIPVLRQSAMDDGLARIIYVVPESLLPDWNDDQFVNWLWRVWPASNVEGKRWVSREAGYLCHESASYSTNF